VTPAATLYTKEEDAKEEEEEVKMAPAAILQRIKLLAEKATGRLTPAGSGTVGGTTQRAATASFVSSSVSGPLIGIVPDSQEDEDLFIK